MREFDELISAWPEPYAEALRRFRDRLTTMPDRLAEELAANPAANADIERVLEREIHRTLAELADPVRRN